jgi:hypothetical protein
VVGELGIAAPRTKFDEEGRLTDEETEVAIAAVVEALVRSAAVTHPSKLVTLATKVVESLGIDAAHVPPAA